ncbi:MAG: T9SS type A sorting domain-containing protein [Chitinophagaceae bacterium]|nr:T9SS type A sorting domain-containing protein [Chitinophagaceae bacterium]
MNGVIYFSADNGNNGRELWKTDGTAAGTVMVKDIYPGVNGSDPSNLVVVGSTLFFSATNGINGTELWKSDGTAAGTVMVKDIWTGGSESYPFNLRNVGGTLFFSADNGANGMELWKSDGTAAGTVLVKDVWPGTPSGANGNFTTLVNQLIFTGNDGVNGDKNWQSDGSSVGTRISNITADAGTGTIRELQETDLKIYASIQESTMGRELYALNFSVVLPLVWLKFEGKLQNNSTLLSWKTVQEENTDNFIVERSTNGRDFAAIGRVDAANTPGTHFYSFTDENVTAAGAPVVYYRLRQNDLFGRFNYSTVIVINLNTSRDIQLFPVPANDRIWITGDFASTRNLSYQVFDNSGKQVMQSSTITASAGRLEVSIASLTPGIYYLRLNDGQQDTRLRIVKR